MISTRRLAAAIAVFTAVLLTILLVTRDHPEWGVVVMLALGAVMVGAFLTVAGRQGEQAARRAEARAAELATWGETLTLAYVGETESESRQVHIPWTEAVEWAAAKSAQDDVDEATVYRFDPPPGEAASQWIWRNGEFVMSLPISNTED